jgi:hypothetical protein
MTTSRDEFIAHITRGGIPEKAEDNIRRIRRCLQDVVSALAATVETLHVN